jgi:hypothetical protein
MVSQDEINRPLELTGQRKKVFFQAWRIRDVPAQENCLGLGLCHLSTEGFHLLVIYEV